MEPVEAVVGLVADVVAIAFLAAIPVCFLKGRRGAGWFGAIAFVVGAAITFPLFDFLRARDLSEWFLLWQMLGITIGVAVIVEASRPARAGSRWQRRHDRRAGVPG